MAGHRWIGIGTAGSGLIRVTALGALAVVAALAALAGVATASAKRPAFGRPAVGRIGWPARARSGPGGVRAQGREGSVGVVVRGASRSSIPSPGHDGELAALACQKASDCWAVGTYQNTSKAFLNQALRWNGKRWSVVKTPDPGGKATDHKNFLFGVACVAPSDCWAVGDTERGSSAPDLNLALHWNGKRWSVVRTPDPAGKGSDDENFLEGVACVKASDCWAVGDTERSGAAFLNEALRWNGKRWSVVRTPDPAGKGSDDENELNWVACARASRCWAVGFTERGSGAAFLNEALRWNGKRWSVVRTPDPAGKGSHVDNELDGVRCVTASDCWAVGSAATASGGVLTADRNEALRWNGKKWSVVKTPQPSTTVTPEFQNPLVSVFCTSAKNCWAVGYYVNKGKTALLNDAMRWDGRRWSRVPTPQPGGSKGLSALIGVRCVSASDCRAVGTDGPTIEALSNQALHWNGKRWRTG